MKKSILICAFGLSLFLSSLVFAVPVPGSGGGAYHKYGTGPAVVECLYNGVTYAVRTANASCPGFYVHRCQILGQCDEPSDDDPNNHACIESERDIFGAGHN